jgi:hypothetical protein
MPKWCFSQKRRTLSILLGCLPTNRVLRSGAPDPPLPWTGSAVASGRALPIMAESGEALVSDAASALRSAVQWVLV